MLSRLLALSLCAITACATWKEQSRPPAEALASSPKLVRVTLADGTQHTMNLARLEGDSIVGVLTRPIPGRRNTVSFPLADVRRIEVHEINARRTWGWIAGVTIAILIYGAIVLPDTWG